MLGGGAESTCAQDRQTHGMGVRQAAVCPFQTQNLLLTLIPFNTSVDQTNVFCVRKSKGVKRLERELQQARSRPSPRTATTHGYTDRHLLQYKPQLPPHLTSPSPSQYTPYFLAPFTLPNIQPLHQLSLAILLESACSCLPVTLANE